MNKTALAKRVFGYTGIVLLLRLVYVWIRAKPVVRREWLRNICSLRRWRLNTFVNIAKFFLSRQGVGYVMDSINFSRMARAERRLDTPTAPTPTTGDEEAARAPPYMYVCPLRIRDGADAGVLVCSVCAEQEGESEDKSWEGDSEWSGDGSPAAGEKGKEAHTSACTLIGNPYLRRSNADPVIPTHLRELVMPDNRAGLLCANDFAGQNLLWAMVPGTRLFLPWTVPEEYSDLVDSLVAGAPVPHTILDNVPLAVALKEAGLITTEHEVASNESEWARRVSDARACLSRVGFCLLDDLIPPRQLQAIQAHSRMQFEARAVIRGMQDSDRGYVYRWACPTASFFNQQLANLVERVVGEEVTAVRPITLYYGSDSMLDMHPDMPPYAYSLSITIDDQGRLDPPMSLSMISHEWGPPVNTVQLPYGKAVLFDGQTHPHFRRRHRGYRTTSMSFSFDRIAY